MPGNSAEEKIRFLRDIVATDSPSISDALRDRYIAGAALDDDLTVREWFVRGQPLGSDFQIPLLIDILAYDPDGRLRSSAALKLKGRATDNGVETCEPSGWIERKLDDLLVGLNSGYTAQAVVETVGGYSGEQILACCMSAASTNRIHDALEAMLGKPPRPEETGGWWSDSIVLEAIARVDECR